MTSAYHASCIFAKIAFGVALAGFMLLTATIIMFSGFFVNPGEGYRLFAAMFCGGAYLVGSMFAIGDRFSIPTMIALGIILNILGAIYWVPSWGSDVSHLAVIGVILTTLWCVCVCLRIISANKSRHSNHH